MQRPVPGCCPCVHTDRACRPGDLQFLAAGNSAADIVDKLLHRVAEWEFVDAGFVDVSTETEEARATILRRAVVGELLSAIEDDVRNAGESFNVVDDGRSAPESDDR